jgi:hypothetical protein
MMLEVKLVMMLDDDGEVLDGGEMDADGMVKWTLMQMRWRRVDALMRYGEVETAQKKMLLITMVKWTKKQQQQQGNGGNQEHGANQGHGFGLG